MLSAPKTARKAKCDSYVYSENHCSIQLLYGNRRFFSSLLGVWKTGDIVFFSGCSARVIFNVRPAAFFFRNVACGPDNFLIAPRARSRAPSLLLTDAKHHEVLRPTFKMSHDRGWRGSCCSEHET